MGSGLSICEIPEKNLKLCIKCWCSWEVSGEDLYLVNHLVSPIYMSLQALDAEDRKWSLHRDYLYALSRAGYTNVITDKAHIAIDLLRQRVKPLTLKEVMKSLMRWRKMEKFGKEDFGRFMREVVKRAKEIQEHARRNHVIPDCLASVNAKRRDKRHKSIIFKKSHLSRVLHITTLLNKGHEPDTSFAVREGKMCKQEDNYVPSCLNPVCSAKGCWHFIHDCKISD